MLRSSSGIMICQQPCTIMLEGAWVAADCVCLNHTCRFCSAVGRPNVVIFGLR